MKVGLYIGDIHPSDGGGYTFVVELLSAINRLRKACSHELTICHDGVDDRIAGMFPEFPRLNIGREKGSVITVGERILESTTKRVSAGVPQGASAYHARMGRSHVYAGRHSIHSLPITVEDIEHEYSFCGHGMGPAASQ